MSFKNKFLWAICLLSIVFTANINAQTTLINTNFQGPLPAGVTAVYGTGGSLSTGKAADGVCTLGAAIVAIGGYLQADVASCSEFTVNMKSSGASARAVTLSYKKQGDAVFTVVTTTLSVQAAASFNLHTLYPVLVSTVPIMIKLEPTSGTIQIHDLLVKSNIGVSNAAEITAFKVPNQIGTEAINSTAGTITLTVPTGTNVSALIPSVLTISAGATISPTATTARDFSSPVPYTVTAQDGTTTKLWTITVNFAASSEKEITAFQLAPSQSGSSVINAAAGTIAVNMPSGSTLTTLVPTLLTISANATISPDPSVSRDFSAPVSYIVIAQDGTTKTWTITVTQVIITYKLTLNAIGLGQVSASPTSATGNYASGTVVTLTATPLSGGTFSNWSGDATGSSLTTTVTMDGIKTVTGNFSGNTNINFNKVVGYASIAGDGFAGPTTGGNTTTQPVLCINGPADFNKLCESLYYRLRVWAGRTPTGGMLKQPLIILIKAGTYDGSQALSTIGSNSFGNDMLDIGDQGDITFIGEGNVTFNFGINVKRSYNVIIRNISFHSYGDDGVNIGYPETHHVWLDHCTFGHPTTIPASSDVPDGTSEVKDGASYVTISWCKYQNHHKTCLMGHSDNNGATDRGRLKVTYFANYFNSTNSRHPRTRFGTVHVLNNMYENVGRGRQNGFGYGIGASNESQVWVEGNFFLDTRWPISADRSTADFAAVYGPLMSQNSNIACFGVKSLNNDYDDSGLTATIVGQVKADMINPSGKSIKFDEFTGPNFTYVPSNDYNYTADLMTSATVRVLVPQNAGADKMNWGVVCGTVPLNLVEFSAKRRDNEAIVFWKTVNEQDVSHFEVERSFDGRTFATIGTIKPNNTLTAQLYTFTDKGPLSIIQYYRLKMVDLDGKTTYSKIVSVSNIDRGVNKLKIYPSVVSDDLTVETTLNDVATLKIVDVLGKVVLSKTIASSNSISTDVFSIHGLPNGFYSVTIENKEIRLTEKFIKQ
jgi:pectate lyase